MNKYIHYENVKPISVLIQRNLPEAKEPSDWWGDLENADYTVHVSLPENDMEKTQDIAADFVDFLLEESWEVVTREEMQSWQ